jgi:uncharacterized protein
LPDWSKPLEVERLADGGADLDFAVPLGELAGLRSQRRSVAGTVRGHVRFSRAAGMAVAELSLSGTATLECQRCMKPMELSVHSAVRVGLIGSAADVARVPAELEPMLAPGGRISIGELVTEEMLLSLPIVPLHGEGGCEAASVSAGAPQPTGEATHRPFAHLAELLKS